MLVVCASTGPAGEIQPPSNPAQSGEVASEPASEPDEAGKSKKADGEPESGPTEQSRFFREEIEPILKSRCFRCHSHAAGETEGGLTLDSRAGWMTGGGRGPAIVPRKPEASLLIRAIRHGDAELKMPPDEKLPKEETERLVAWITNGAFDPRTPKFARNLGLANGAAADWWSLRPLHRPTIPQVKPLDSRADGTSANNAIDLFIAGQLRENGLIPAPPAGRRALIRRLYFDLHGLPPSPDDVEAFEHDADPLAYEKLVERLLNSPRYGERWARHWLDTVHFADSHGCEHDVLRPNAWRFRDYVISSLNRDTPWDRFIREQLAADWFYPTETELTPALGFISAGPLELSRAGTAPVTFDYLDRDDIVTQTMATFASTTANCARCHDHKFDPITQEDYYSLQAVFAGGGKGDLEFDTDSTVGNQRRRWNTVLTAIQDNESRRIDAAELDAAELDAAELDAAELDSAELDAIVAAWEQKNAQNGAVWQPLLPETFESSDGATLKRLEDDSILASGVRPEKDTYTVTANLSLKRVSALRLDVLSDESLPMKGPGRCDNGNLHLSEFAAFLSHEDGAEPTPLKIRLATADWDQAGWTIAHSLDGNVGTAWGIYPRVGQSHYAVFELEQTLELKESSKIVVHMRQLHGGGHLIGRLKLYATAADPASASVLPEDVRKAIQTPIGERSAEQRAAIAIHAVRRHAERQLSALPESESVYAWSTSFSHAKKLAQPMSPKLVHVLTRGEIDKPGEIAFPGALSAIENIPARFELSDGGDEASRRAALAEWLSARDNPLTWRSAVNRVWAYHFGRGLCDTPNDFGRMGGTPSHPELLDWLAVWFRDDANGSLKKLHRLILLSATWRQSTHASAMADQRQPANPANPANSALSIDAENRLLWRMPSRPLDAESYRDSVLQIAGRIDLEMGGPGIQQFTQSPGQQTTPKLDYDAYDWKHANSARRSIHRTVWRGIADPFMESLDFPDLGLLAPKRGFSVSALQALVVFNNDFVLHHSEVLADQLQAKHHSLDEQATQACRLVFQRAPSESETALLTGYAAKHGLAATCRILFNSNEFLFVE